jgi:aminopeptidase N
VAIGRESRRGRRLPALGAVIMLAVACTNPADPIALSARRTGADARPGSAPSATATTPPTTTPPPTATAPTATTAAPVTPATSDISTSAGDRRFPRLGSTGIDVEHYDVELDYDPDTHAFSGTVVVAGRLLAPATTISLDTAGPVVASVSSDGQPLVFRQERDELIIELDRQEPQPDAFDVSVDFTSQVLVAGDFFEDAGVFPGIRDPDGVWAVNEPDGTSRWMPVNDHPTDKATWTFSVSAPDGMTAVSNGEFVDQRPASGGRTTWEWDQREPMASYLVTLLIGDYEIVDGGVSSSGVALDHAVLAGRRSALDEYTDITDRQLAFFADRFGPYPFDRYGVAIADSQPGLAMETQGLSLFSADDLDGSTGYLQHLLLSHELAHQWFGDAVSPAQWDDIWLNEGWATYCQWLWLDAEGLSRLADEATQALGALTGGGGPVERPNELFGDVSYNGGAVALHALRLTIGDAAFFAGARRWVAAHLDGAASTADFVAVMEQAAGRDLSGWFDAWVAADRQPGSFPAVG